MITDELKFLAYITVFIVSILVILLVYLLARKANDIRKRTLIEKQKEKYHTFIYANLMEGNYTRRLTPRTDIQKIAVEELLNHYGKMLEGNQEKARMTELATLYLADYYRKQLKHRKWSYRMNALYYIEDFHLTSLLDEVKSIIEQRKVSQDEIIHILRILASFQYQNLFEKLTIQFQALSENEYRNILIRLNSNSFEQFILGFQKCQQPLKNAILDVIAVKKELKYLLFTEKVFMQHSGETKLRALKALAELGYVKSIEPYLNLLHSHKWEERMVSAKLMGSLQEAKGLPRLIDLLQDQIWWVRSQAAQAIAKFPNGEKILQHVFETSQDPFARDMAWEWLHKGV